MELPLNYIVLFIFGLAVGSFLNVVALRYRPGQKLLDEKIIGGRSQCPRCHKNLAWYELIPLLSFLWQRGKCRHCGHRLSLQYPLVEILSGLIFIFIPLVLTYNLQPTTYNFFWLLVVGCWLLVFLLFLLLSIIDFRQSIIPDQINLSLGILGLILVFLNDYYKKFDLLSGSFLGHYAAVFGLRENIWINHLFASLLGLLIFGAIIVLSKGKGMGWGDFKLVGALGLIFGWPDIILVLFLAFIIGGLLGIILLVRKTKGMKDAIPFGPFLIVGASLVFFFGYQIMDWYFKLFNL